MNAFISLKKQLFYRLLAVSAVAAAGAVVISLWMNHVSFRKEIDNMKSVTLTHFRERISHLNQSWEEEALRTRTLIELTRCLEDRRTRWEKLNSYLLAQSGMPVFSHIAVADEKGRLLFRFGRDAQTIPEVLEAPATPKQEYLRILDEVYRIFRLPVWMGPDESAYLMLFMPLDNALLMDFSYPDTDLYLVWNGKAFASSLGKEAVELFPAGARKNGRHYERLSIPFAPGNERESVAPLLVMHVFADRPFSVLESGLISMTIAVAIIGPIWFVLVFWIAAKVRTIISLDQATTRFAAERKTPQIRDALSDVIKEKDELGQMGSALLVMMSTIEEQDKRRLAYEAELVERERSLRQITASLGEGLYVIDEKGRITFVNLTATRLLGWSPEELIGVNAHELFHHTKADGSRCDMKSCPIYRVAAEGETLRSLDEIFWRRDGSSFPVSLVAAPMTVDGKAKGAVVCFNDITEQKRSEEKLLRYAEALKKSNEELEQFALVSSHDLQEPLRKIATFSEALGKRYLGRLDPDADRYIGYIVEGAHRMREQILAILYYSRLDREELRISDADLGTALEAASEEMKNLLRDTGAEIAHDRLPAVRTDPDRITEVFRRLLDNAIKFRGADPLRIHVSAEEKKLEWIISVRDNGIGIEPEYLDRIFVMFQRLHSKEEYPGAGIGLAICKKIVERLGGRIWAESTPRKGSAFYFTIPRKAGE